MVQSRATFRAIVVIVLAVLVLAESLPDIRRVWLPLGIFGVTGTDTDQVITGLDENSPAVKAGLKIGDRIDVAATDPNRRFWLFSGTGPETPVPGQQLTFAVIHDGKRRYVTMVSQPEGLTTTTNVLLLLRELSLLLFVGIGAALVLLRPSIATWAFYFICLAIHGAPSQVAGMSLGVPWNYVTGIVSSTGLLGSAGLVGVVVFAALFLHERSKGWRAEVYRWAPLVWVVLAALNIYGWLGPGWFGVPGKTAFNLYLFLEACLVAVAMSAFVATYISARGTDKQRIRWVILGFGIALVSNLTVAYLTTVIALPYWLYASLLLIPIVVPITVAYAVIKHRVIDVSFVVSRAIVYGILTTLIVGAFSLVDWLFIDKLKLVQLGTIAEMGVAIAGGFWFNGLHRRVDSLIDATFFRERHRAEVMIARNAAALPLAETPETVAHFLVDEPMRAFSLASAALFRRRHDGLYIREASNGWEADTLLRLDHSDEPLLLLARAENGPLSLHDHPWRTEHVPDGNRRPILALPIVVRRELAAVVFYGGHLHGEALDPDEIRIIAGLAPGAAAAYDHIEAEALRKDNDAMKNEVDSLRTRLAEIQIQPA